MHAPAIYVTDKVTYQHYCYCLDKNVQSFFIIYQSVSTVKMFVLAALNTQKCRDVFTKQFCTLGMNCVVSVSQRAEFFYDDHKIRIIGYCMC